MSVSLRIKRSLTTAAPPSLNEGELAYSEQSQNLFLGTSGGNMTIIGGLGTFLRRADLLTEIMAIDGSASGLDADLLDGQHGAYYLNADNFNAGTLPVGRLTGTYNIGISGNAATATKLATGRSINASGDATGSTVFDGTGNVTLALTLAATGVAAGTYPKVTVDSKGRVTAGSALAASDIPTLTASKISDFDTQVRSSRLDQMAAPTGNVSMANMRLVNLQDPVGAQDAATKAYVDAAVQGLNIKAAARVSPSGNVAVSAPGTALDGVTLSAGDRVLLRAQTAGAENGIYVFNGSAVPMTRTTDADTAAKLKSAFVFVTEGTNADNGYVMITDGAITLGTTAMAWSQFSGAGQVTAGAGLTKSGNTIDVIGTANRITVNADNIDIASTYVGQASINTLGVVTTGTWQASTVALAYGGTGATTAAGARTNLGLGDISTQNASAVNLTGGSITGVTIDNVTLDGGTF